MSIMVAMGFRLAYLEKKVRRLETELKQFKGEENHEEDVVVPRSDSPIADWLRSPGLYLRKL